MNTTNEEILSEKESATIINKCSACGASADYDIESGNLKCGHCGTIKEIEQDDKVARRQLTDSIIKERTNWQSSVFRCDSCGAKEVLDKKDITSMCPFCGSSNIVDTKELAGIRPDSVIPFQITKENAIDRFKKWIKSRFLAPRIFKQSDIRERINAVYTSTWSFTAETQNSYSGTLGKTVTYTTRNSQGQTVTRTKINWFRVNGQIRENYIDYLVQSGDRISPAMFSKLKPFDLKLIKVYRQEYLSGIAAEHYSRNLETCFNDFSNFVRADLRRKIMRRHNADQVQKLDIKINYTDRKFNYMLLPVYVANYAYNKKTYNFYVNGVNGVIVGKYPKSKLKLALIGLGIGILVVGVAVVYYLIS